VPIIRADASPVKTAPDTQGGMVIPNRESTVFNPIRGQQPDTKVENLLAQTEQPVDRDKVFAGVKTDAIAAKTARISPTSSSAPEAQTVAAAAAQMATESPAAGQQAMDTSETGTMDTTGIAATDAPAVTATEAVAPAPAPAPAPVAATKQTVQKPVKVASIPAKMTAKHVKPHAAGHSYAQLASLSDKGAASASWKRLQKKYPQLSGTHYRVEHALVKGKTYYRLQAGPLSAHDAKDLCHAVNAKKAGACLVVGG
jgi:hypothetical protein